MTKPILTATDLELGYDNEPSILTGVNFQLYPNEFVGITGPNGTGKTTFIRSLLGLITPRSGRISYYALNGDPLPALPIGYMPQQNRLDKAFPISVADVVVSGLYTPKLHRATKEMKGRAMEALETVGMAHYAKRVIGHLSGGQLQRVLLARAFVSNPMLLVLDEPSTYVDRDFEETLLQLLPQLQQQSAIVMVSHNEEHLRSLASRLFYIDHTFRQI